MNPISKEVPISKNSAVGVFLAAIMIWLMIFIPYGAAYDNPDSFPQPNPPWGARDAEMAAPDPTLARAVTPTTEWKYHKTSDNQHPDGNEQQLMWLMNRARSNPTREGIWLTTIYDRYMTYTQNCGQLTEDVDFCYTAGALDHWDVDLDLLQIEFAGYDAKPPAAFDVRLYRAAKTHSEYLIDIDDQNHTEQFKHISDENFSYTRVRGNAFSYALSAMYGHAAFNVDWGPDGGDGSGMQPKRGHRLAVMSLDGDYTNVGIAAVPESDSATDVGPLVVTGNYCRANPSAYKHYNRFLVGTVWSDKDGDQFFDPGEGIGDVTVMPDHGPYYAVTSIAGGYALPITAPGTYEITFSGAALNGDFVHTVMIGDDSVLLDLVDDSISVFAADDAADEGSGGGCFITALPAAQLAPREPWACIVFGGVALIGSTALGGRKRNKQ